MAIGRTESFQELIQKMEGLFGETILGSDVNHIKHLFHYLRHDQVEFYFGYEDQNITAVVEEVLSSTVVLYVPDFTEGITRRVRIRFEVINVLYVFEVNITQINGHNITINIPTELQSAQLRHHKRVPVDDLFMNFMILFRSLAGGKRMTGTNINSENRFPHLMREIRKDNPDLGLLNRIFADYIRVYSPEYEFVFYGNTSYKSKDFIEIKNILERENRSIYISNTAVLSAHTEKIQGTDLLTNYYSLYNFWKKVEGNEAAEKNLKEIMREENKSFEVSYVLCPITLYDKLEGHLKVYTTSMDRYQLTIDQAEQIHILSEIISYALTKCAIKEVRLNSMNTNTKIVDISIGGLQFEIEDESLFKYLRKHNKIKMFIPLGNVTLEISGEIVRYIPRDGTFLLGVNFFQSNPDDMKFLENYIFQKQHGVLTE